MFRSHEAHDPIPSVRVVFVPFDEKKIQAENQPLDTFSTF